MGFFGRLFNRKKSTPGVSREPGQGSESRKWWQFWRKKQPEPYEPEEEPEEPEEPSKEEREAEEAQEKQDDEEKRREERKKARDTFNERFGTGWSEEEYGRFFDTFGDPVYTHTFGSTVLIYAAEYASNKQIPFDEFVRLVDEVVREAQGAVWNQQEAADRLYSKLENYYNSFDDMDGWMDDLV